MWVLRGEAVTVLVKYGCALLFILNFCALSQCEIVLSTLKNQTRQTRDIRHSSRSSRLDRASIFTPGDITPDGDIRAPVLLGVRRDLTESHGPEGFFGVCHRVYRVLYQVRLSPAHECQKHRSRQSVLGDISEFYHTLMESGRFNQTLEFPLADQFSRFVLRTSFVYLASRSTEPAIMIETTTEQNLQHSHVLCVESIKCPEQTTTTSTTAVAFVTVDPSLATSSIMTQAGDGVSSANARWSSSHTNRQTSDPFWDTLLSGTEPKSWFLATVSLGSLCFLLLIVLLITWLYVCRLKRLHMRRRCRGTCRFGCRCPPEVIRQTVTDAAVCGPLDSQNQHSAFASPMSQQGNGSIRSGSGFGTALYPAGTMTSSRWGSNGVHKVGNPLYISMGNASDKTALLAANYPNTGCIISAGAHPGSTVPGANSIDNMSGTWSQLNGQRPSSQVPRRRLSQDALHRSTSDGSSISGHAVHTGGAGASKGPIQGRGGMGGGYLVGPVTNVPGTMLITNGNAAVAPQTPDANGSAFYQQQSGGMLIGSGVGTGTVYSYTDSGRGSGVSPGLSQSPTRLSGRKLNDRTYYVPHGSLGAGPGPVTVNEEEEDGQGTTDARFFASGPAGEKLTMMTQGDARQATYNLYGTDSLHPNQYATRGSEGDLLNITPPSGFYDPGGSGGTDSGLVNGSSSSGRSNPHVVANSFGQRTFLTSLYPILGSPGNAAANEWSGITMTGNSASNAPASSTAAVTTSATDEQHMVGALDAERTSALSHGTPVSGEVTGGPYASAKPLISPRIYTASERML